MKTNTNYKSMYLESTNGSIEAIEILNSELSASEKIANVLRILIASAQNCEDIFIETNTCKE